MRKFILIALLCSAAAFGQDQEPLETNEGFRVHVRMRFHAAYPVAFGDNAFGEGHDAMIGFGLNGSLLQVNSLRFGLGYEYAVFRIRDEAMIGTYGNTKFKMYYAFGEYDKRISQKVTLSPGIGIGYANTKHGSWTANYGHQDGYAIRAGINTALQVSKHGYFYLGVHYIYGNFTIETNAAYEDYYAKTHQVQLSVGFQID